MVPDFRIQEGFQEEVSEWACVGSGWGGQVGSKGRCDRACPKAPSGWPEGWV